MWDTLVYFAFMATMIAKRKGPQLASHLSVSNLTLMSNSCYDSELEYITRLRES